MSLTTLWGRVTLICVRKLTIIGSDNGLSPGRRQTIIWTNAGMLLVKCTLRNKLKWNLYRNSYIYIQENALENVVCKMVTVLPRPQCVKMYSFGISVQCVHLRHILEIRWDRLFPGWYSVGCFLPVTYQLNYRSGASQLSRSDTMICASAIFGYDCHKTNPPLTKKPTGPPPVWLDPLFG